MNLVIRAKKKPSPGGTKRSPRRLQAQKKLTEGKFLPPAESPESLYFRVIELESMVRDLTRALHRSEHRTDSGDMAHRLPVGIICHNDVGLIDSANPFFSIMSGLSKSEIVGYPILSLIERKDIETFLAHLLSCKQRLKTTYAEVNIKTPGGKFVPVQFITSRSNLHSQDASNFQSVIINISEQHKARAAADLAQRRYFTMLETLEGVIWEASGHSLDITFVSQFADRMFGYPSADWTAPNFWENHIHVDDRERVMVEVARALREQTKLSVDYRVVTMDRRVIWIYDQIAVQMVDGKPRLLGVAVDITEQKKIEAELKRSQALLEERVIERTSALQSSMAELEAFSYSLSHDLRAPLRAIRGYSEILQARLSPKLDKSESDLFHRIQSSARRMDNLIQDVLKYSGVVRAKVDLKPIQLDSLVMEVIQDYPALRPPNAEIELRTPLGTVLGHEAFLGQCISNLLCNAVKFVDSGTIPKILIYSDTQGDALDICVQDNGFGISKEDQPRVFGMFSRLHHPKEIEGTGIGLAIVKKAAERMGGSVGLESQPGHGSRFWIRLPAAT